MIIFKGIEFLIIRLLIKVLFFYKKIISPYLPSSCRFFPTCSEYFKDALIKYGLMYGSYKGLKRILRCNPFFPGGYDPVK